MNTSPILLIEDDFYIAQNFANKLQGLGENKIVHTFLEAQRLIQYDKFKIAFIDLDLGAGPQEGIELIKNCREHDISVIVLTENESPEILQQAYLAGCSHYFSKSNLLDNFDITIAPLIKSFLYGQDQLQLQHHLLTKSKSFTKQIYEALNSFNLPNAKILITGATGTGKTQVAKLIHKLNTPSAPFVEVNLAEIPENLIESHLFGHKKGSFTGANNDYEGLLINANGGTLFLDEIGSIPLNIQIKLLKVIEEKSFYPVGGKVKQYLNFRLITATCDQLENLIQNGKFRVDLYFRLRGQEIKMPTLKNRIEDLPIMIEQANKKSQKKIIFTEGAIDLLKQYEWPGNIREFQNFISEVASKTSGIIDEQKVQKILYLSHQSTLDTSLLNDKIWDLIEKEGLPNLINSFEKEAYLRAQKNENGRVNAICKKLQISKSVLYRIQQNANHEIYQH